MKVKTVLLVLLAPIVFTITSCVPKTLTKIEAFPKMYNETPNVILVFPPINESTAADAKDYYSTTIAEPLAESGFYVLPIEVINDILQSQGLYDIENIDNLPLKKFNEYFGADAVLLTKILKWDTNYYVIGGNVTVSVDFKLISTKTSEILWEYNGTIVVNTSGDDGGAKGLAGLIVAIATTAIKTAITDYTPQARKANFQALNSIPFGKYHKKHNKDKNDKVVLESKIKDKK
jgi:hypothetical protein